MESRIYLVTTLVFGLCPQSEGTPPAENESGQRPSPIYDSDPIRKGGTVLGLTAGYGLAHDIANGDTDYQFPNLGGASDEILTHSRGHGLLSGNVELSLEALPIFLHYDDAPTYGASFTLAS
jgi:hypothetical protein